MLNRFYIAGFASLFLFTSFLPTACVPDYFGGSSTTNVAGKVFLDGQPVAGAKVLFIPLKLVDVTGHAQNLSYATTDAEGKFTLETAQGDVGAAPGMHRVIISKQIEIDESTNDESRNLLADLMLANGESLFWQPPEELIPVIYNRQSILSCNVDPSLNDVEADFELSSVDPLLINN